MRGIDIGIGMYIPRRKDLEKNYTKEKTTGLRDTSSISTSIQITGSQIINMHRLQQN